jgi:hypothetical protein
VCVCIGVGEGVCVGATVCVGVNEGVCVGILRMRNSPLY